MSLTNRFTRSNSQNFKKKLKTNRNRRN